MYHSSRVSNLENHHPDEAVSDHSLLVAKLACILGRVLSPPGGGGTKIPEIFIRRICQNVRRAADVWQAATMDTLSRMCGALDPTGAICGPDNEGVGTRVCVGPRLLKRGEKKIVEFLEC